MSLKDDFLEALRSVKRDFFRDSEYTDLDKPASEIVEQHPPVFKATLNGVVTSFAETENEIQSNQEAKQPDNVVFEAFRQASNISNYVDDSNAKAEDEVHNYDGVTDEDDDIPGNTTPFRDFDQSQVYDSAQDDDGRRIVDFDDGGVYGDDKTVISKNTIIRGALMTQDSVRLLGQVLGDIECKSNIVVAGKVRGNTTAANAYIFDAQVDGDVRCDDVINISNDAWILGNIRAQQAEINGKIKGNIEVRHTVTIGASSSILGDISTDELEIKRGAFINGQVMMYSPSRDVIDRFDQFKD